MSFNWQSAAAYGLGELGNQANAQADRLSRLEEKRLEEEIANRREEAKLTRERALQVLGYDEGGVPVYRGDYENMPEEERPILYSKGKERAEDKVVGYTKEGGPVLASEYKEGMELYEKPLDREKPKEAKVIGWDAQGRPVTEDTWDGQTPLYEKGLERKGGEKDEIIGYDAEGRPIFKSAYDGKQPVYKDPKKRKEEGDPEYKPGQALEKIAQIDKTIATLKAGDSLSASQVDSIIAENPELAAFMGASGKKMDPADRDKAIASLMEQRQYLMQFAPKKGGILGEAAPEAKPGGNKNKPPLSSFYK